MEPQSIQNVLYTDESLDADIRELASVDGAEDFSGMTRRLFRLGVDLERENRRISRVKGEEHPCLT